MELEGVVMLVFIIVSVLLLIIPSIMISRQPQSSAALSFSVSDKNDYGLWKYLGRIQRFFVFEEFYLPVKYPEIHP